MSTSDITRYVLVDQNDQEQDFEYTDCQDAIAAAGTDHAVIERHYTYDDSELVWTPNGRDSWPPKKASRLR